MPPERTAQVYGPGITAASKSVLLELTTLLRAYHEALGLVGGWVPFLLLEAQGRDGPRPARKPRVSSGARSPGGRVARQCGAGGAVAGQQQVVHDPR